MIYYKIAKTESSHALVSLEGIRKGPISCTKVVAIIVLQFFKDMVKRTCYRSDIFGCMRKIVTLTRTAFLGKYNYIRKKTNQKTIQEKL